MRYDTDRAFRWTLLILLVSFSISIFTAIIVTKARTEARLLDQFESCNDRSMSSGGAHTS